MDVSDFVVKPLKDFAKSSARLVKRCTKPDRKGECLSCGDLAVVCVLNLTETASALLHAEYLKVCGKTAVGFIVMGFIGFFVKLLFIVSPSSTCTAACALLATVSRLHVHSGGVHRQLLSDITLVEQIFGRQQTRMATVHALAGPVWQLFTAILLPCSISCYVQPINQIIVGG